MLLLPVTLQLLLFFGPINTSQLVKIIGNGAVGLRKGDVSCMRTQVMYALIGPLRALSLYVVLLVFSPRGAFSGQTPFKENVRVHANEKTVSDCDR